jgi:hypothetical protein
MPKRRRPTTSTKRLLEAITGKSGHKYGAKPTTVDGKRFASKREARRYGELKLLQQAGKIDALQCQVRFKLVQVVHYVADFVYIENGKQIVEDVKGFKTREYKAKKKLMAEQHDIVIKETR